MTDLLIAATSKGKKKVVKATAVALYRVSTDKQELSPQAQKAAVEKFCSSKGITLVGEFTEVGVSGAAELKDRPQLVEALQMVAEKKAEYLVVLRQDRLSRDVTITGFIDYALGKSGARVLPVEGGSDDANPMASMMKAFQIAMAAQERQLIASRTKAALGQLKAQNKRVSRFAPYGFQFTQDNALVENTEEQAVIGLVKELVSQGKGGTEVSKVLSSKGIRNRAGQFFNPITANQLMKKVLR